MRHAWKYVLGILGLLTTFAVYGAANPYAPTVPGAINLSVTQSNIETTICVSGWTTTIRPPAAYTNKLKAAQLPTDANQRNYEEDHAISLELGGNPSDPENLWPQPYPQAKWKDRVENLLHKQVCAGAITLAEAQKDVLNWYPIYKSLSHSFGATVEDTDNDDN